MSKPSIGSQANPIPHIYVENLHSINDVAPVATTSANGLMSKEDKAKMNSINFDPTGGVISKSGRFGIKIDKFNSDPATRCEYIFDAKGMGPAGMNFQTGVFNYGDWGDIWFVKNNKPCVLNADGTVLYYLDPDDYTKQADGSAADITTQADGGNVMSEIPLVYIKRWEDGRYLYEVVSETQYDETYKAYAHTDASGTIKNKMYYSCYGSSGNASKLRSLSGKTLAQSLTAANEIAGSIANGTGWYTHSWSQRELIRSLCTLIGCSTDSQAVFGIGNLRGSQALLSTGTLNDKGQFYGTNANSTSQVKVFHIEKFWGDQWDRVAGLINDRGTYYVKLTPEGSGYRVTDTTGYTNTGLAVPAGSSSYIRGMYCGEYGMLPSAVAGSATTYFCDCQWANNGQLNYALVGGSSGAASAVGGPFALRVDDAPSYASWYSGSGLLYI